jgi:hypothetical protein
VSQVRVTVGVINSRGQVELGQPKDPKLMYSVN